MLDLLFRDEASADRRSPVLSVLYMYIEVIDVLTQPSVNFDVASPDGFRAHVSSVLLRMETMKMVGRKMIGRFWNDLQCIFFLFSGFPMYGDGCNIIIYQ